MSDVVYGERTIAQVLKAEGVEALFGIHGGLSLMAEEGVKLGMKMYHVRHEQAAAFAADAYGRITRKPGICFTHAANGFANVVSGAYHAKGTLSPVVLMNGSHPMSTDGDLIQQSQSGNTAELVKNVCKWTHRVTDPSVIALWVRQALRDAVQYPPGPITLELPHNITKHKGTQNQSMYVEDMSKVATVPMTAGDPAQVRKVVETLLEAKRPLLVVGDGVYWSEAAEELVEFAELLQIPTNCRRMARGAVPEANPLSFGQSHRRGFIENADIICLLGLRVTSLDRFFRPPTWPSEARYLQVQEVAGDVWFGLPTETTVVGTSKLVLRQMIDYARSLLGAKRPDRSAWLETLSKVKARQVARLKESAQRYWDTKPVHPEVLAAEIASFLDPSSTVIYDSFTATTPLTARLEAKYSGQIVDAGLFQTLGHSIGMAIGAQVARPGKQVLVLIGDGGFGIGGMDMETLARCDLPAVVVLFNNSSWGGRAWAKPWWYPGLASYIDMLPDIRYDQAFNTMGCHTEYVTTASEIRPALYRAFNSVRASLINVIGDATELHPVRQRANFMEAWVRQNKDELHPEALAEMSKYPISLLEEFVRNIRESGEQVTLKEVADFAGVSLEEPVPVRRTPVRNEESN